MPTTNFTAALQPYKPTNFPQAPDSQARYLPDQDQRIANCLNAIIQVMKELEARMNTAGI